MTRHAVREEATEELNKQEFKTIAVGVCGCNQTDGDEMDSVKEFVNKPMQKSLGIVSCPFEEDATGTQFVNEFVNKSVQKMMYIAIRSAWLVNIINGDMKFLFAEKFLTKLKKCLRGDTILFRRCLVQDKAPVMYDNEHDNDHETKDKLCVNKLNTAEKVLAPKSRGQMRQMQSQNQALRCVTVRQALRSMVLNRDWIMKAMDPKMLDETNIVLLSRLRIVGRTTWTTIWIRPVSRVSAVAGYGVSSLNLTSHRHRALIFEGFNFAVPGTCRRGYQVFDLTLQFCLAV